MRERSTPPSTPEDLAALRQQLIASMATGQAVIETPQLGRVEYRTVAEIQSAISWLDGEILRLNPQQRSFVVQSNRGTGDCL
jgi:hypothetical protein